MPIRKNFEAVEAEEDQGKDGVCDDSKKNDTAGRADIRRQYSCGFWKN